MPHYQASCTKVTQIYLAATTCCFIGGFHGATIEWELGVG